MRQAFSNCLVALLFALLLIIGLSGTSSNSSRTSPSPGRPSQPRTVLLDRQRIQHKSQLGLQSEAAVPLVSSNPSSIASSLHPPDRWSPEEIADASRQCSRMLAPISVEVDPEQPMKHGQCGLPAPVRLRALDEGQARVQFRPPLTVSCRLVAGLPLDRYGGPTGRIGNARLSHHAHIGGDLLLPLGGANGSPLIASIVLRYDAMLWTTFPPMKPD